MIRFNWQDIIPKVRMLMIQTVLKWQQDDCLEMGAALSYYALFSLFPIFLVILSILGIVLGPQSGAYVQILSFAKEALPPDAFEVVAGTFRHLNRSSVGASIVGFVLLLVTASSVFAALDRSVDKIWQVRDRQAKKQNWKAVAFQLLKMRLFAFAMVLGTAALMFLSLILNIATKVVLELLETFNESVAFVQLNSVELVRNLQGVVTFLLLVWVLMTLFKILPSTRIYWRDVWLGSVLTASLLMLLQQLVSNSVIRIGSQFRSYGVIGGVMVLLLWLYLTCQVFFLGSEFTFIYAHLFGSRRPLPEPRELQPHQ